MPPGTTAAPSVSLRELADLAIGTPEVGAVNFTALHTLIVAMLKNLNLQDTRIDFPSPMLEQSRLFESPRVSSSRAQLQALESQVEDLGGQVQDLSLQLETMGGQVQAIVQNFPSQAGGLDARDWLEMKDPPLLTEGKAQVGSTKVRKDGEPVPKGMELLQDIKEDAKILKEAQQKAKEQPELHPEKLLQRVDELEKLIRERDKFLEIVSWKLRAIPDAEEATMVTWEELEQAVTGGRMASQMVSESSTRLPRHKGQGSMTSNDKIPSGASTKHPSIDEAIESASGFGTDETSGTSGIGYSSEGVTGREQSKGASATGFPGREEDSRAREEAGLTKHRPQLRAESDRRRAGEQHGLAHLRRDEQDAHLGPVYQDVSSATLPRALHGHVSPDQHGGVHVSQGQIYARPDQHGLGPLGMNQPASLQPSTYAHGAVPLAVGQLGVTPPGMDEQELVLAGMAQSDAVPPLVSGRDQQGLGLPGTDQPGMVPLGTYQHGVILPGIDQHGIKQAGMDESGVGPLGTDQHGLVPLGVDQHGFVIFGTDQQGLLSPGLMQVAADQQGFVQPSLGTSGFIQPGTEQHDTIQPSAGQPALVQPSIGQPGLVQPGAGQPGLVQPGAGQPGLVQPGAGQPGLVQPGAAGQPGLVQPGAGQPGLVQPGAGQPGLVQPGAAGQPGLVQPGAGQPGLVQPGAGQPGLVQPGAGQPGLVQPGAGQPASVQPGAGHPGLVQPGMYQQGLVQPSAGQPGLVRPGAAGQPGLVQPGAAGQPGLVQPGAGQPGLVQPGAAGQPGLVQPGAGQPGLVQPGAGQPGLVQPGAAGQPGLVQPGAGQPGLVQPGAGQPGLVQPGAGQPGLVQPDTGSHGFFQPGVSMPGLVPPGTYPPGLVQPGGYPHGLVQSGAYPRGFMQPHADQRGLVQPVIDQHWLRQSGTDQGLIPPGTELHGFPTYHADPRSFISPRPYQHGVAPPGRDQYGRVSPLVASQGLASPGIDRKGLVPRETYQQSLMRPGPDQRGPKPLRTGVGSARQDQQHLEAPEPEQHDRAHSVPDSHGPGYQGVDQYVEVGLDPNEIRGSVRPGVSVQTSPSQDAPFLRSTRSLGYLYRGLSERSDVQGEKRDSLDKLAPSFPMAVETFRLMGELIGLYVELKENVKDLDDEQAGQTDLEKIQYLLALMVKKSIPADLQEQLKTLKALTKEVQQEKAKLEKVNRILEGEGEQETGKEVNAGQLSLQLGVLRVTVADIEKELAELRESQERGKVSMEHSVSEASLYLQDQLDKLRTIIENMMASSSTLLSMSMSAAPHKLPTTLAPSQIDPAATCPACSLDLSHRVSTLVQRYEQLQDMVSSLAASRPSKKAKQQSQDEELLGRVQSAILQVQGDCEKLSIITGNLIEDHRQRQKDIEVLYQGLEKLQKEKANREHLELEINVKADKSALAAKVSRVQFDATTEQLNHMMQELVAKMSGREGDWQKMLDRLLVEMDNKLDRLELDPVKQSLEDGWKSLRLQLKERSPLYQVDEAAAMRRQLLAHFHCLSCDRPLEMPVTGQVIPLTPVGPGLPGHRSIRPYTVFELEQVRQQSRNLQLGSAAFPWGNLGQTERSVGRLRSLHSKMLMDIEKVQIHFGGSVKASSQMIRELLRSQCLGCPCYRRLPDAADHTYGRSPRSCGGSHTLTYPYRRTRLQHLAQGLYPTEEIQIARKHDEVDILGLDGHIYKGRMDTRLPDILNKDNSGIKHKAKQSRPHVHRQQSLSDSGQLPSRSQSAQMLAGNDSGSSSLDGGSWPRHCPSPLLLGPPGPFPAHDWYIPLFPWREEGPGS
ncbi:glutamine-rich protein 2 isoform X2 [Orcinus orca]|uniref:glutamine-rich protein 2 isoform X2 n=1 Tax=Orcinus orca TaxID=9733 RepID=UPI0021116EC6|nr:glutamine-rich protein 2 isoform X2 [Orcinus orca]